MGPKLALFSLLVALSAACDENQGAFECRLSKKCIPANWKCDGAFDCQTQEAPDDVSDEHLCDDTSVEDSCRGNEYKCDDFCLPLDRVCDGIPDCFDAHDEVECPQVKYQCF